MINNTNTHIKDEMFQLRTKTLQNAAALLGLLSWWVYKRVWELLEKFVPTFPLLASVKGHKEPRKAQTDRCVGKVMPKNKDTIWKF